MKVKLWIVIYHHRHGEDVWPLVQDQEPTEAEQIAPFQEEYEPERADEWFESRGPFEMALPVASAAPAQLRGKRWPKSKKSRLK